MRCKLFNDDYRSHEYSSNSPTYTPNMSRDLQKNLLVIFRFPRYKSRFAVTRQHVRYRNQGRTAKNNAPPVPPSKSCFPDEKYKLDKLIGQSNIYCRLMAERHSTPLLKTLGFPIPTEVERLKREKVFGKTFSKQEYKLLKNTTCPPRPKVRKSTTKAIAIDCEMAYGRDGTEQPVSICIVDVIQGKVLLNSLVKPRQRIFKWNSRIHGIDLSTFTAESNYLNGWAEARSRLLELIDKDTVIVGHALRNDLRSLRVAHDNIVDTAVLTSQAVFGTESLKRFWSLKTLCTEFLDMRIQAKSKHSALEDAMATREVALWCIYNPDKMHEWASKQKEFIVQERDEVLGQVARGGLQRPTVIQMECPKTWSEWRAWRWGQISFAGVPW